MRVSILNVLGMDYERDKQMDRDTQTEPALVIVQSNEPL